ncbi:hypothetical protein AKO1_010181 [Acrasis kona]|uniref:Rieske domain-containing protein n=1 Tax=Acrasis kona TaxID=1008807 RepID=A0AAW2ZSK2_9EUKA
MTETPQYNVGFKENWYPIIYSNYISPNKHYITKIWGEPVVAFRDSQNNAVCLQDLCPDSKTPLSRGIIKNGSIQLGQWVVSTDGTCEGRDQKVKHYRTGESQGIVFIWWGTGEINQKLPTYPEYTNPEYRLGNYIMDVDVNYIFHLSNLLDPVHYHLLHDGAIPNVTKDNYGRLKPVVIDDGCSILRYKFTNPEKNPDTSFDLAFSPGLTWTLRKGKVSDGSVLVIQQGFHVPMSPNRIRVLWRMYLSKIQIPPIHYMPEWCFDLMMKVILHNILGEDVDIIKGHFNRSVKYGAPEVNRPLTEDTLVVKLHDWEKQCLAKDGERPWFQSDLDRSQDFPIEYPPGNKTWMNRYRLCVSVAKAAALLSVAGVATTLCSKFLFYTTI